MKAQGHVQSVVIDSEFRRRAEQKKKIKYVLSCVQSKAEVEGVSVATT